MEDLSLCHENSIFGDREKSFRSYKFVIPRISRGIRPMIQWRGADNSAERLDACGNGQFSHSSLFSLVDPPNFTLTSLSLSLKYISPRWNFNLYRVEPRRRISKNPRHGADMLFDPRTRETGRRAERTEIWRNRRNRLDARYSRRGLFGRLGIAEIATVYGRKVEFFRLFACAAACSSGNWSDASIKFRFSDYLGTLQSPTCLVQSHRCVCDYYIVRIITKRILRIMSKNNGFVRGFYRDREENWTKLSTRCHRDDG